jgi:hypothetical protein
MLGDKIFPNGPGLTSRLMMQSVAANLRPYHRPLAVAHVVQTGENCIPGSLFFKVHRHFALLTVDWLV